MAKSNPKRVTVFMLVSMAGLNFDYKPRDLVEVPEDLAKKWAESGTCSLEIPETAVKVHPVELQAATQDETVKAIADMDPKKDYGSNHKPSLAVLEKTLGKSVGSNLLNQAYDEFRLAQKNKHREQQPEGELIPDAD